MDMQERNKALFMTLVHQYQMQGWISLGKLKNPVTDKTEKNLDLAKMSIDMLDMLKDRTRDRLSEEESRLLDQTITDLKLNYTDEYERMKEESPGKKPQKESPETGESSSKVTG